VVLLKGLENGGKDFTKYPDAENEIYGSLKNPLGS
jgi:hypothetical protein